MLSLHSTRRNIMDRDTEIAQLYASLPTFKFDEGEYVDEIHEYVSSTYKQHYAQGKYQATDIILDSGLVLTSRPSYLIDVMMISLTVSLAICVSLLAVLFVSISMTVGLVLMMVKDCVSSSMQTVQNFLHT